MTRKWMVRGAGMMCVALAAGIGVGRLCATAQDQQQSPAYTLAEYNAYEAADSEQNPQQKIKRLDDFVMQYPNSTLMTYVYRDYYQTDYALKNFAGTMEYVDRIIALGDKIDAQTRLEALVARAQAYDAGSYDKALWKTDAFEVQTKARDAAALGLKALHDWKKPAAMAKDQYDQQVKSFKAVLNAVYTAAYRAAEESLAIAETNTQRMGQRMAEDQAIAIKTREEQAKFEQRKKEAVDLGMKPGTPEYVEYVGTGKITDAPGRATGQATVHITSSPSGGEIYVDGKFVGNTPSDISLATGEHTVKVTSGGKEWLRTIQITAGDINIHADWTEKY